MQLFFFQVLPLVREGPVLADGFTSRTLEILQTVFSLSIGDNTGDSGGGVCILASMSAVQKMGFKIVFQAIVFGAIGVCFLGHWFLHKFVGAFRNQHLHSAHYVAVAMRFTTIAYITLVLVPLRYLQCVDVGGEKVWWWDASQVCFKQSWQIASFVAICVLGPAPLLLIVLLVRWRREESAGDEEEGDAASWRESIRRVLTNGVREEQRWFVFVFGLLFSMSSLW